MTDFYRSIKFATGTLDNYLSEPSSKAGSVYSLTDRGRREAGIQTPAPAGTRVRFAYNLGSVLTYKHVPEENVLGSVIMVRTAFGDCTGQGDDVFVKWDDGTFQVTNREHLRVAENVRVASDVFQVHASKIDLEALFMPQASFTAGSEVTSDLVRKSTQDLWHMEERNGSIMLTRLFDEDGEPLKA